MITTPHPANDDRPPRSEAQDILHAFGRLRREYLKKDETGPALHLSGHATGRAVAERADLDGRAGSLRT